MDIGTWQIVIVLGIVAYIIVRNIKNRPKDSSKNKFGTKLESRMQELSSQKEEKNPVNEPSNDGLGVSLKRLKKMYNEGHLSKVEFEKAKNKLLK